MIEAYLWIASAACFAGFVLLGYAASRWSFLRRIDSGTLVRGRALRLAALFTYSGRAAPLTVMGCLAIATLATLHAGVVLAIGISIAQLCSQAAVHIAKTAFQRARPVDWLLRAELGFSYPSGHAATAVVFFGSWLVFVVLSPIGQEPKAAIAALLFVWIAGIGWSRVALGAHYPLDVAGGTLFGLSWLSVTWAIFFRAVLVTWH